MNSSWSHAQNTSANTRPANTKAQHSDPKKIKQDVESDISLSLKKGLSIALGISYSETIWEVRFSQEKSLVSS